MHKDYFWKGINTLVCIWLCNATFKFYFVKLVKNSEVSTADSFVSLMLMLFGNGVLVLYLISTWRKKRFLSFLYNDIKKELCPSQFILVAMMSVAFIGLVNLLPFFKVLSYEATTIFLGICCFVPWLLNIFKRRADFIKAR